MDLIIGLGGEQDRARIPLATARGTPIPNARRKERPPESMKAALEIVTKNHETTRVRSLTSVYNCIGMAFACRRTCIEPEHVPTILKDDGYEEVARIAELVPGDLVVYETAPGEVSHIAVVVSNEPNLTNGTSRLRVLSQWGSHGEYFHDHDDVADLLGKPVKFYSERKKE